MYRKVLFHTRATGCLIKGFCPVNIHVNPEAMITMGNVAWWSRTGTTENDWNDSSYALDWAVIFLSDYFIWNL